MNTRPPRRVRPAALALLVLLAVVAAAGCRSPFKRGSGRAVAPASSGVRHATTYLAPAHRELGRVISHAAAAGTALIELSPFAPIPADLAGRSLIARHPETLAPSARLVASGRRAGAILGAYVIDGAPAPGHEVVLPPSASRD